MMTFVGLVPEETFTHRINNLYVHWWDWTSVDGIMENSRLIGWCCMAGISPRQLYIRFVM